MSHYWGEWPDKRFADVGHSAQFIGDYCRKYGRINVTTTKEKYGTARVYCSFGISSFHCLTHPGYVYGRYPKWLWNLNCDFSYSKVGHLFFRLLNKIVVPYQMFIYRRAYELAFKKWPLIKKELLMEPIMLNLLTNTGNRFRFAINIVNIQPVQF